MRITVLALLFTLFTMTATAAKPEPGARMGERLPEGMGKYILVLRATSDGPRIDVTKLGGRVLHADGDRRVILLPLEAAAQVRAAGDVAYLQRVWMGEPLDSWNEPDSPPGPRRLQSDSETDLTWQLGPFAYDGSGNISSTGSDSYRYDSAGRLIKAVVSGKEETYAYDSFGNLTSKVTDGQSSTIPPIDSYSNRIAGEEYDVAGNLTTSKGPTPSRPKSVYQYDALGMLTKITTPYLQQRRMIYTPDDERIGNDLVGNTPDRWYVRDMNGGKVLREFSVDSGDNWLWVEDYIYNEGQLAGGERVSYHGGKRHFHLDHLGSVRMITSSARMRFGRHDFYPFGIEQTRSIQEWENFGLVGDPGTMQRPDPMKFTSHERDFHGLVNVENTDYLDYMHARYYDPNHGRFLTVDPGGMDPKKPQSWNRYGYVMNNPVHAIDPDGRETYVITTFDYGIGSHSAVLVARNGDNVLYDPAGTYDPPSGPRGSGDMFYDEDADLKGYVKYQESTGSTVKILKFNTTPQQEAKIKERIDQRPGSTAPGYCARAVSSVVAGIGPFKDVKRTTLPGRLYSALVKLFRPLRKPPAEGKTNKGVPTCTPFSVC